MNRALLNKWLKSWVLAMFLPLSTSVFSSEASASIDVEDAIAHYIVEVAKHLRWPEEDSLENFTVAVIDDSAKVYRALERKKAVVRGKSFQVSRVNTPEEAMGYAIVYMAEPSRDMAKSAFDTLHSSLLVTLGRVDLAHQLVRFIYHSKQIDLDLNAENLRARGFSISINMLKLAGTKDDLGAELKRQKDAYDALRQEADKQQSRLDALSVNLGKANERLLNKERLVVEQETTLAALAEQVESSRLMLQRNNDEIESQQRLLDRKRQELKENEALKQRLEEIVANSSKMIEKKNERLSSQLTELESTQKKVAVQRVVIWLTSLFGFVFIVLSVILYRTNTLRRAANRELEHVNHRLYELATTDSMTGLTNRRHFIESVKTEFGKLERTEKNSGILLIDIDYFKSVNDTYGHAAGDNVIIEVARRIKGCMRGYDQAARFGGEEFAVMLVDCTENQAIEIAERIRERVASEPMFYELQEISVTVSVGVAKVSDYQEPLDLYLGMADKALYQAKDNGRNRVVVFWG